MDQVPNGQRAAVLPGAPEAVSIFSQRFLMIKEGQEDRGGTSTNRVDHRPQLVWRTQTPGAYQLVLRDDPRFTDLLLRMNLGTPRCTPQHISSVRSCPIASHQTLPCLYLGATFASKLLCQVVFLELLHNETRLRNNRTWLGLRGCLSRHREPRTAASRSYVRQVCPAVLEMVC